MIETQFDTLTAQFPEPHQKVTHLAIGAHPDDVEIFAFDAIQKCYKNQDHHFVAIVCSNGSGAPVFEAFAQKSKAELVEIRKNEQRKATLMGEYAGLIHFNLESRTLKENTVDFAQELKHIIEKLQPKFIYTHNPFDQHQTHRAVCNATYRALAAIKNTAWLKAFYGCEVWGSLDWLSAKDKIVLGENDGLELQQKLLECFYSQNIGSQKRYDLGTLGRKLGNATFYESNHANSYTHQSYAIDLKPLISMDTAQAKEYLKKFIDAFKSEAENKLHEIK